MIYIIFVLFSLILIVFFKHRCLFLDIQSSHKHGHANGRIEQRKWEDRGPPVSFWFLYASPTPFQLVMEENSINGIPIHKLANGYFKAFSQSLQSGCYFRHEVTCENIQNNLLCS